ncbi:15092_t:CDS:2, partial [Cetraspora pellucida]
LLPPLVFPRVHFVAGIAKLKLQQFVHQVVCDFTMFQISRVPPLSPLFPPPPPSRQKVTSSTSEVVSTSRDLACALY